MRSARFTRKVILLLSLTIIPTISIVPKNICEPAELKADMTDSDKWVKTTVTIYNYLPDCIHFDYENGAAWKNCAIVGFGKNLTSPQGDRNFFILINQSPEPEQYSQKGKSFKAYICKHGFTEPDIADYYMSSKIIFIENGERK